MSAHIVVSTEVEVPNVYLVQGKEYDDLRGLLRTEQRMLNHVGYIYALVPDVVQPVNTSGLVRLKKLGDTLHQTPAEEYLARACYYANMGDNPDVVLAAMAQYIVQELRRAREVKELNSKELLNP